MDSKKEYVCYVRGDGMDARAVFNEDEQIWWVEAYMRRPGGLLFLQKRYSGELPTDRVLAADLVNLGWFSPRPAILGRPFDPSMSCPVLGLFLQCCGNRQYDAEKLLRTAFPNIGEELWDVCLDIAAQAGWEDTEFPDDWDNPVLIGHLLVALDQVGYTTLADALQGQLTGG